MNLVVRPFSSVLIQGKHHKDLSSNVGHSQANWQGKMKNRGEKWELILVLNNMSPFLIRKAIISNFLAIRFDLPERHSSNPEC